MILTLLPIGGLHVYWKGFGGCSLSLHLSFKKYLFIYFVLTLFFKNNFYWSMVVLQCVNFGYTAE